MRSWQSVGRCALVAVACMLALQLFPGEIRGHEIKQTAVERRQVNIPIADFTLVDQNGKPFQFKTLRGKVVVAAFAYTTCPDVCPLITAALRQVQSRLTKEERTESHLLTVTTDPEIDSPKVLAAYAKRYGAELGGWSFLTGDDAALRLVWKSFGVGVERKARGLVDHTPLTAIIDRQGVLRYAYIGPSPDVATLLGDVRSLMNERR
ncbi:MAG: SCO family protein [Deltaproteobacteria bacterium]|nr:SCO family protein [Deltaproteobacteria bacterium]